MNRTRLTVTGIVIGLMMPLQMAWAEFRVNHVLLASGTLGRTNMKRLLFLVVALTAISSFALAAPPVPNGGTFLIPAGSVFGECAFDVQATLTGKTKNITLPGDRFIVTSPGAHITLTNLSDISKTITLNITGAFHQ